MSDTTPYPELATCSVCRAQFAPSAFACAGGGRLVVQLEVYSRAEGETLDAQAKLLAAAVGGTAEEVALVLPHDGLRIPRLMPVEAARTTAASLIAHGLDVAYITPFLGEPVACPGPRTAPVIHGGPPSSPTNPRAAATGAVLPPPPPPAPPRSMEPERRAPELGQAPVGGPGMVGDPIRVPTGRGAGPDGFRLSLTPRPATPTPHPVGPVPQDFGTRRTPTPSAIRRKAPEDPVHAVTTGIRRAPPVLDGQLDPVQSRSSGSRRSAPVLDPGVAARTPRPFAPTGGTASGVDIVPPAARRGSQISMNPAPQPRRVTSSQRIDPRGGSLPASIQQQQTAADAAAAQPDWMEMYLGRRAGGDGRKLGERSNIGWGFYGTALGAAIIAYAVYQVNKFQETTADEEEMYGFALVETECGSEKRLFIDVFIPRAAEPPKQPGGFVDVIKGDSRTAVRSQLRIKPDGDLDLTDSRRARLEQAMQGRHLPLHLLGRAPYKLVRWEVVAEDGRGLGALADGADALDLDMRVALHNGGAVHKKERLTPCR